MTVPEPLRHDLKAGHRYLIREGSWASTVEERHVVEVSTRAVCFTGRGGVRFWRANEAVNRWVIVEDLGVPVVERDPCQELRDEVMHVLHRWMRWSTRNRNLPLDAVQLKDRFQLLLDTEQTMAHLWEAEEG